MGVTATSVPLREFAEDSVRSLEGLSTCPRLRSLKVIYHYMYIFYGKEY